VVEAAGGRVVRVSLTAGASTTKVIETILANYGGKENG